jgi:hypothetical protein
MAAWLERVVWAWVGESEVEDSAVDSGTSVMEQMQMVLAISAGSGGELAVTGTARGNGGPVPQRVRTRSTKVFFTFPLC